MSLSGWSCHRLTAPATGTVFAKQLAAATLVLLALATSARAEYMAAHVVERVSANGQFMVRAIPGSSMGDAPKFSDRPKGPYATAEWHRLVNGKFEKAFTITLLNPVGPVQIEVADDGTLVTFDDWYDSGQGTDMVIYSPMGDVIRKYTASELNPNRGPHPIVMLSDGQTAWRCNTEGSVLMKPPNELWVHDIGGGRYVFKLDTGAFNYQPDIRACGVPPVPRDRENPPVIKIDDL